MKLHSSAIDKLLTLFQNYGGTSPDDVKLKNMISSM
jgi:hypothetical protein